MAWKRLADFFKAGCCDVEKKAQNCTQVALTPFKSSLIKSFFSTALTAEKSP